LRWKLLPLLVVGIANAGVWYRVFVPQGPTFHTIGALVAVAIAAGIVTPKGLWWFSTVCMCLPPLMIPNYHGALIFHLLFGFIFPPMWIYFLMNFTPVGIGCAGSVLAGCAVRKFIVPSAPFSNRECLIVPRWMRLTSFRLCLIGVFVFGNWIGFMSAIAPFSPPPAFMVPGSVVGTVVSHVFGKVPGQYATAIGNGSIYGMLLYCAGCLHSAYSDRRPQS
jgi:hypothetical protein